MMDIGMATTTPVGTVLVVDDSPEVRFALARILRRAGFAIEEAESGSEALEPAARCDVVVLDVKLPDLSGLEVAQQLRANPATATVPILQRSAVSVDDAAKVLGLDSGADAYLTDPIAPEVLVATVRALARVRRAERAATDARSALVAVMNATPIGHVVVDGTFRIRDLNAAARTWAPGVVAGDPLRRVLPEPAGRDAEHIARRALHGDQPAQRSLQARGRVWWVHGARVAMADGTSLVTVTIEETTKTEEAARATRQAGRRSRALAEVSKALESVSGFEERANRLVGHLVPAWADAATVEASGPTGRPRLVAMAHADPSLFEALRELRLGHALGPEHLRGVARVMHIGEPQFLPDIDASVTSEFTTDDVVLDGLRRLDIHSYLAVPLSDEEHGADLVLTAMTSGRRRLDQASANLSSEVARHAEIALASARVYEREHRIASVLQHELLPPNLADIPGLDIAARYLAAGPG
jgi:CheY-like chemotaxis protein